MSVRELLDGSHLPTGNSCAMAVTKVGNAILRALNLMTEHPSVSRVGHPQFNEASGIVSAEVEFEVHLPSEWKSRRQSPTGVRAKEVLRFDFPAHFPLYPPRLSLRADFNRNLPHIQPWLTEGRPVPCIYDGKMAELLQNEGMLGIANQTAHWLRRAAQDTLIDPHQGWEPVRRDCLIDSVVADADRLSGLVKRDNAPRFYRFYYLRAIDSNGSPSIHGTLTTDAVALRPDKAPPICQERALDTPLDTKLQLYQGQSLGLVVWSRKSPSGKPIINDTYLPETMTTIGELKKRATLYGCGTELNDALDWFRKCLAPHQILTPISIAVVLLARRPFKVIGTRSSIELCLYVVDVRTRELSSNYETIAVRPAAQLHAVSRTLLARMSGGTSESERPEWTLIGAGSLGSKIALHLARAGNGPAKVVDNETMRPHNVARHSLVPMTSHLAVPRLNLKAAALCEALYELNQKATPIPQDAVALLTYKQPVKHWSKQSWAIVNTTASSVVREALTATNLFPTRIIETSLFAGGRVGMITVEGPNRNPNTSDLMAEFYGFLRGHLALAKVVFGNDGKVSRELVGQGCGSLTMPMSDGRISLFAAGMSEYLLARQRDGLPEHNGQLLVGQLSHDGLAVDWQIVEVPPTTVIATRFDNEKWQIHIHQRAVAKINEEVARWPGVETGGVLMGRISEASRTVRIVDTLPAPEDSLRTANQFVLGKKGLSRHMERYSDECAGSLYCLGTWHNHISSQGPSMTDRATARSVSLTRLTPSVFLIQTPDGFQVFLSHTTSGEAARSDYQTS